MKSIQIFDPALCCSTGVCGAETDQALITFSADVDWAKQNGAHIERFNLAQQPLAFAENATVKRFLERSDRRLCRSSSSMARWRWLAVTPTASSWRAGQASAKSPPKRTRRMLRRQFLLLKDRHEISRTASSFPVLHGEGRRRQNVDRLRDGDPAR